MDAHRYHVQEYDIVHRDLSPDMRLWHKHHAYTRFLYVLGVVALICGLATPHAGAPAPAKVAAGAARPAPAPVVTPQTYFREQQSGDRPNHRGLPADAVGAGLFDAAQRRINAVQSAAPGSLMPIPLEWVGSAATVRPGTSLEAVQRQAEAVAAQRGLSVASVRQLVAASTQKAHDGRFQVNLLALNLALDLASTRVR
jgi:hypothetical protein